MPGDDEDDPEGASTWPVLVAAPDEDNRWPRKTLFREALAAFCEVRIAIRRAQVARAYLLRRHVLPTGFSTWDHTRPKLDAARGVVERIRPWLLIGFFGPLRKKDGFGNLDGESYHDRAIHRIEPLINALAQIEENSWVKMSAADRISLSHQLLLDLDGEDAVYYLDLAFHEAQEASKLLKLPEDDQKIVVVGSYACRRLDALANLTGDDDVTRQERAEHERSIMCLANQLGQYELAEKIEGKIINRAAEATFPQSAIYDRFKEHLIVAVKTKLPKIESGSPTEYLGEDIVPVVPPSPPDLPSSYLPDAKEAKAANVAGLVVDGNKLECQFNGVKLDINAHADFKVLAALADAGGAIVTYTDLLERLKPGSIADSVKLSKEAPQEVKDAVAHIRRALKTAGAAHKIENARCVGYKLLSPDE